MSQQSLVATLKSHLWGSWREEWNLGFLKSHHLQQKAKLWKMFKVQCIANITIRLRMFNFLKVGWHKYVKQFRGLRILDWVQFFVSSTKSNFFIWPRNQWCYNTKCHQWVKYSSQLFNVKSVKPWFDYEKGTHRIFRLPRAHFWRGSSSHICKLLSLDHQLQTTQI